jgi:hypothetical protein
MTREQSREQLQGLGLPEVATRIFDGPPPHPALRDICASPEHVFAPGTRLPAMEVIPLWESGIEVTAVASGSAPSSFIQFSLERPDDVEVLGTSFQAAAADVLVELWELEQHDDILAAIADLLEFRHLPRLLAECSRRLPHQPYEEYRAWRSRFLASCT